MMKNQNKGAALLITFVIATTLSVISIVVISILIKSTQISLSSKTSLHATYIADLAFECINYYELRGTFDVFGVPRPGSEAVNVPSLECGDETVNLSGVNFFDGSTIDTLGTALKYIGANQYVTYIFAITSDDSCADITLEKRRNADFEIITKINVSGKSPCVSGSYIGSQAIIMLDATYGG